MRCKPCGAPRNPSADRCDYCQSWHDLKNKFGRMAVDEYNVARNIQQAQAQMMANDAQRQIQYGYQSAILNAGGFMGLLGRGF